MALLPGISSLPLSLSLIDLALMAAVAQHDPVNSSPLRDPSTPTPGAVNGLSREEQREA